MRVIVRPIVLWPGEFSATRSTSPFSAGWSNTVDLLKREVGQLGATEVVLQAAVDEGDIRNDGGLRASARPEHPGVIVSLEGRQGPLSFPCDRFLHWQANVRAVALGMEALRRVDRYGITRTGEQYQGWRALGSGTPVPAAAMTVEEAARFLSEHAIESPLSGRSVVSVEDLLTDVPERRAWALRLAYRLGAQRLHPDHGGGAEAFGRLQEAKALLEAGS